MKHYCLFSFAPSVCFLEGFVFVVLVVSCVQIIKKLVFTAIPVFLCNVGEKVVYFSDFCFCFWFSGRHQNPKCRKTPQNVFQLAQVLFTNSVLIFFFGGGGGLQKCNFKSKRLIQA